jgi:adenylate cyclase, class 2
MLGCDQQNRYNASMIEIERKFHITPSQKRVIEERLQQHSNPSKAKHQIDVIFLYGITSFKDFTQGMPVVRLRTEDDSTRLTYKRKINAAGDAIEHEVTVSSADVMRSILAEMGYHTVTTVDKVRREARTGDINLVLDTVKGLGDFLEIEVLAENESSLTEAEKRIMATAATLGLAEADIESRKYDQLVAQL